MIALVGGHRVATGRRSVATDVRRSGERGSPSVAGRRLTVAARWIGAKTGPWMECGPARLARMGDSEKGTGARKPELDRRRLAVVEVLGADVRHPQACRDQRRLGGSEYKERPPRRMNLGGRGC